MNEQYYLPSTTARWLGADGLLRCNNLGLILDKYPPQRAVNNSEGKSKWLKELEPNKHIDARLAASVYQRWLRDITDMHAFHFNAVTQWRMVVGLGGKTILEIDLTLHHLYGIPIIPASALKGLTRAYATTEEKAYFVPANKPEAERKPSTEEKTDHPDIQRIFGTQKDAGSVIFFDAMPVDGNVEIDLDIMNAHYPKYYSEKLLPTNNQDPNPVTFLTVKNTTFTFALAPRRSQDTDDVKLAGEWLQKALQEYGVGGKTSAGYGYFTLLQQAQAQVAPASEARKTEPVPYIRPDIPKFNPGQGISGTVIARTEELQSKAPEAKAFLRYRDFSPKSVLIVVEAEEAANWAPGQTKNSVFLREEERDGCTVLICQPGVSKKKKG